MNKQLQKLMFLGQCCNFTYGLDLEFTNCPDSSQVINTIQIAYNSNVDDVIVIFFPMDNTYKSDLKDEIRSKPNALSTFLTSRRHVKVGVNIIDDCVKIEREFQIRSLNCIDVQTVAISLGIPHRSMDDLGQMFVPEYMMKSKPGGGYLTLDNKKIQYAANDAVNSFLIYYYMIGATKQFIQKNRESKLNLEIDENVILFATAYFQRIKKVRFTGFCNHMTSCYSSWCKLLSQTEGLEMSRRLIDVLQQQGIVRYRHGFYERNR